VSVNKTSSIQQRKGLVIIIAVIVGVAILAAGVTIAVSGNSNLKAVDPSFYDSIPQSRTADGGFVLGNPDAPITVVEFADFLCSHCQNYKLTIDRVIHDFVATGQAKLEYRTLPAVDPTQSVYAAQLAECADTLNPGAFWQAHDVMFELISRSSFDPNTTPREFSDRMGLAYGDLLTCAAEANQVSTDSALAKRLGVSGTPAVLFRYGAGEPEWLDGQPGRGAPPYDMLEALIEAAQ
jgi:protein-disulfide isomerase